MTFLEALQAVHDDHSKMAVPVITGDDGAGIVFTGNLFPCWHWATGYPARIPTPKLLFGEWKVVRKNLTTDFTPA